jgi:N-glycosylase/DNA lyase
MRLTQPDSTEIANSNDLFLLYLRRKREIRKRLREFREVKPEDYFYELVYCLLTPQSSAANAFRVVKELQLKDFRNSNTDPEPLLGRRDCYIRFHRTKAKHLLKIKVHYSEIEKILLSGKQSVILRQWLVHNVMGMGWKEASHFLRNIGHRDLAILDRHILRYLLRFDVIKKLPKTLTAKKYLQIEKNFRNFSNKRKIPMDELDLLFWSMGTGNILK